MWGVDGSQSGARSGFSSLNDQWRSSVVVSCGGTLWDLATKRISGISNQSTLWGWSLECWAPLVTSVHASDTVLTDTGEVTSIKPLLSLEILLSFVLTSTSRLWSWLWCRIVCWLWVGVGVRVRVRVGVGVGSRGLSWVGGRCWLSTFHNVTTGVGRVLVKSAVFR